MDDSPAGSTILQDDSPPASAAAGPWWDNIGTPMLCVGVLLLSVGFAAALFIGYLFMQTMSAGA